MHEILCKIEHRGDEDAAISEAVRDGIISREEETVVRDEMRRFWQLTADKDWFDSDYTILNEREIILPDGTVKRPDRVMIQGGKATVIDYKFGLSTREEHKQQVAEYCALLQQMGYQTEGWLCYVNKKSIIRADR